MSDDHISFEERDHQLDLWTDADRIVNNSLKGWQGSPGNFSGHYLEREMWLVTAEERAGIIAKADRDRKRVLKEQGISDSKESGEDELTIEAPLLLRERLVSFPSAPQMHQPNKVAGRSIAHSIRVLDLPSRGDSPVDRVFTLHNGLDEVLGFEFFITSLIRCLGKSQRKMNTPPA